LHQESQLSSPTRSKKKTKEKKNVKTTDQASENAHLENDGGSAESDLARHKSLLSKREKSAKKAEKLAKKAAQEATNSEEATHDEAPLIGKSEVHPLEPLPQPEPVPESGKKPTFSALPPWLAYPLRVSNLAKSPFTELGIPREVASSLQSKGFGQALAIQTAVIPLLLPGDRQHRGDVLVSAATGSGKTLAYVLPMISDISRTSITRLRGVIVMPTRVLVDQSQKVCEICASAFTSKGRRRVKIGTASGNQSYKKEVASMMKEQYLYSPDNWKIRDQTSIQHAKEAPDYHPPLDDADDESDLSLPGHTVKYTPKVDILICTPGRLVQHIQETEDFTLDHIKWLVVDEADRLLDQSYQGWLELVMDNLAKYKKPSHGVDSHARGQEGVTKILISATVTRDVALLSALKLKSPKLVVLDMHDDILGENSSLSMNDEAACTLPETLHYALPETLQEYYIRLYTNSDKPLQLLKIIENFVLHESMTTSSGGSPAADLSSKPRGTLVFTNSNESALRLSRLLKLLEPPLKIEAITSTISSSRQKRTLQRFQEGHTSIIIASDMVARGLDLPLVRQVVNYEVPRSEASYVHRVGRTARAGMPGSAITLYAPGGGGLGGPLKFMNLIRRAAGKEPIQLKATVEYDEALRERYEAALDILGREVANDGQQLYPTA
jgi:ATP-dependent RNA helicase DDX51/DBP6